MLLETSIKRKMNSKYIYVAGKTTTEWSTKHVLLDLLPCGQCKAFFMATMARKHGQLTETAVM